MVKVSGSAAVTRITRKRRRSIATAMHGKKKNEQAIDEQSGGEPGACGAERSGGEPSTFA